MNRKLLWTGVLSITAAGLGVMVWKTQSEPQPAALASAEPADIKPEARREVSAPQLPNRPAALDDSEEADPSPVQTAEPVDDEEATGDAEVDAGRVDAEVAINLDAAVTEAEERILSMYDGLVQTLGDPNKECDAMAEELTSLLTARAKDVERWTDEQKKLSPEQLEHTQARLMEAAGTRVQRAQEQVQRTMGKCADNTNFQTAMRNFGELSVKATPGQ